MAQGSKRRRQVVVAFDERPDMRSAALRGGKGASLVDMRALGLPVPPGFTITTTVARAVMQHGQFPKRLERQLCWGIEKLERDTGKKFGDPKDPLLLSVRSGAEVSMPGMMDTILNLGLNDQIVETMEETPGEMFPQDIWRRFSAAYRAAANCGSVPCDVWEQLRGAIREVLQSWGSQRAVAYRKAHNISEHLGTAVTVQAMVFGNRNERSGTGVVFSRDPNTGNRQMYGEFLQGAQGEDVVSGQYTPMPIAGMKEWNEPVYDELASYLQKLEDYFDAIVDVEFTIEDGKLWLLQCRPAKPSAEASATFAVSRVWDRKWSKDQAIKAVCEQHLQALDVRPAFAPDGLRTLAARGFAASPGVVVGKIASTSEEAVAMKARGEHVVLVRDQTDPNDLPGMLVADAIVTFKGGATSHAAIVARQLGIPAVVGAEMLQPLQEDFVAMQGRHTDLSVCGNTGQVFVGALPVVSATHKKEVNIFLRWVRSAAPEPRIAFEAVEKQVSVNRILAEVYLLELMAFTAKGSSIEQEVVKMRNQTLFDTAELFTCYLALAVVGELRYAWHFEDVCKSAQKELKRMEDVFGICGSHNRGDKSILAILEPRSRDDQVEFFRLAARIFSGSSWNWHSSYGGLKWAAIAQAGADFLSGKLNHGVYVDHVFDLRHNGGRLFDKHSMVNSFTNEEGIRLQLDYKRTESDLGNLYHFLVQFLHKYDSHPKSLSTEFARLWEKGKKLNLWQEKADEQTYKPSLRRRLG